LTMMLHPCRLGALLGADKAIVDYDVPQISGTTITHLVVKIGKIFHRNKRRSADHSLLGVSTISEELTRVFAALNHKSTKGGTTLMTLHSSRKDDVEAVCDSAEKIPVCWF
jgi:hypothetical protein